MSEMTHDATRLEFDLHDRLAKAMRVGGHSSSSLADALGVHRNTISNYLSGRTVIDRRTLIAWAFATGVPVVWLETGATDTPDGNRLTSPYNNWLAA